MTYLTALNIGVIRFFTHTKSLTGQMKNVKKEEQPCPVRDNISVKETMKEQPCPVRDNISVKETMQEQSCPVRDNISEERNNEEITLSR